MLHIDPTELAAREERVREAFAAQRGKAPTWSAPTADTVRKLTLLAGEIQLLSAEIGGQEWSEPWSETTDAWIILRRAAEMIDGRRDAVTGELAPHDASSAVVLRRPPR